ncbi:MAG: polyprenyl synthetase family protein [Candidatus Eisenbacteria sp.]|nr:polyprenyl synthetase family protein [Candidatus Eisenbacteria bacterium]
MSRRETMLQGDVAAAVQEARANLAASGERVNQVLKAFWEAKSTAWHGFPEIIRGAFRAYDQMTSSGKKIRAGLVILGFEACRSARTLEPADPDGIYRAAGSVEILHNAFLIHDDIVDNSDLRRSVATVHRQYAELHRERFVSEEQALSYGRAVALNFGDKGQALAQELLLSSGFPSEVLLPAINLLSRTTADTVAGQLLDVSNVPLAELSEEVVLQIHEFKTAHYTVMLPLQMGAVLAHAKEDTVARIRDYALPIGIAFQIQDDILGLYGEERVLGKPVDSDVREGKKTLLMAHAYEASTAAQREVLARAHGNEALTADDLDEVRQIVRETGALARSEALARELVERGRPMIAEITEHESWRRVLVGLAEYLILRRY